MDIIASQTVSFACNKYAQKVKYNNFKSKGHSYLPIVVVLQGEVNPMVTGLSILRIFIGLVIYVYIL